MAENYLITGYWGEPHVTSENDRGINAAIFGAGRFVLPVGEQFRAEYIGNNTVRVYDGKLIDNGAVAGIPAGEYIDLLIPEAGQGMNRNDLIVFQYSQDASTLIEKGVFMVLPGEETSGTASDPALSQQDILSNEAALDQMALWRVSVSSTVISAPVQLFEVSKNIKNAGVSVVEATSGDGEAYYATVPGVTELYAGLEIIIIPQFESTSETITLDVNGLGAKNVRLPLSSNTTTLVMPEQPNYYTAGRPVKLRYDATWLSKGAWVVAERQRTSGNDLYGTVPIECGGTGADNAEEARENLGAAPSGFGLGDKATLAVDCNTALNNGWYYASSTTANKPASFNNCNFFVLARNTSQIYQYFFTPSDGCVLQRYTTNGGSTWVEEWVNPPMTIGEECRTTERWNGKPVYVALVLINTLPASGSFSVQTPISDSDKEIIGSEIRLISKNGSGYTRTQHQDNFDYYFDHSQNFWWVRGSVTADYSNFTGYVLVKAVAK